MLRRRDGAGVRLLTRNGIDWSGRFPLLPFLKGKPERPKTGANRCGGHARSPILVRPIVIPGAKHPEFACPLAGSDKCNDDSSGKDDQMHGQPF